MKQRGFTMIELIMVMAIAVILMAVAAPSMSELIANQRVRSMAGDLHLALVRTRSEAIKRNTSVTLSPIEGAWSNGWIIADPPPASPDADPLLRQTGASGVTVATSVATVTYNGTGRPTTGSGTFELRSSSTTRSRCVLVDTSGRASSKEKVGATC